MAGSSFAFLFLVLLLTLGCILGAVLMIRAVILGRRRVARPACARCRYEVEGLETLNCPECGADLREAGIITPRMTLGSGRLAWIVAWTLVLPLPAVLITLVMLPLLPKFADQTRQFDLTIEPVGVLRGFTLTIESGGPRSRPVHERALITVNLAAGSSTPMEVSLPDESFRLEVPVEGLPGRGPFDRHILAEWIQLTSGLEERPDELAIALIGVLDDVRGTGASLITQPFSGSVSHKVIPRSKNLYGIAATAFWLTIWVIVVIVVMRRGHRINADNQ